MKITLVDRDVTILARMTQSTPSFAFALIKRLVKGERVKPFSEWTQHETLMNTAEIQTAVFV
ncbi:MAG TPA: hypothetical protein VMW03_05730 [Candidatus Krumholzibacteriaceae bacterium]|nr:hypothetical protein [Candidatus Krumholzibacteriaceae bacterium]